MLPDGVPHCPEVLFYALFILRFVGRSYRYGVARFVCRFVEIRRKKQMRWRRKTQNKTVVFVYYYLRYRRDIAASDIALPVETYEFRFSVGI